LLRFQKDLHPHLSFSYRFGPSTLQRRIRLKTLLYSQCAYSNELDACAFQYIGPGNWRHSRFFVGTRSSTLENSVFKKHRFQTAPLWRAFSNDSVFGDRFRRCSVDDSSIRSKRALFSFENGLVWTGPQL